MDELSWFSIYASRIVFSIIAVGAWVDSYRELKDDKREHRWATRLRKVREREAAIWRIRRARWFLAAWSIGIAVAALAVYQMFVMPPVLPEARLTSSILTWLLIVCFFCFWMAKRQDRLSRKKRKRKREREMSREGNEGPP